MSGCDLSVSLIGPLSFYLSAFVPTMRGVYAPTILRLSGSPPIRSGYFGIEDLRDKTLPAFGATSVEHSASGRGTHSCSETVGILSFSIAGLKRPFHFSPSSWLVACLPCAKEIALVASKYISYGTQSQDFLNRCLLSCCLFSNYIEQEFPFFSLMLRDLVLCPYLR